MSKRIAKTLKWVSLPALLIGSMFSSLAGSYEMFLNYVICLGALISIHFSLRARDRFFAAGCVAVAIVFSPLSLVVKMFFLIGLAMIGAFVTLVAALRAHPVRNDFEQQVS
jgi:hypothetical protein